MLIQWFAPAFAQDTVYDDALASGWTSWSWSGTYDFSASDLALGSQSIRADAGPWGALSVHTDAEFGRKHGLEFAFAGAPDEVIVVVEADGEGYASAGVAVSELAFATMDGWTLARLDLSTLGAHAWTRIDFQDATGAGTSFHLDDVYLFAIWPTETGFRAAEPIGARRILLYGTGDASAAAVTLNGAAIAVTGTSTLSAPDRVVLTLAEPLSTGELVISLGDTRFLRTLTAASATLGATPTHDISPLIYGMAFPETGSYLAENHVTLGRWGGNAVTAYNPIDDVSNAGMDWYFENRDAGSAEDWIGALHHDGAAAFLTIPALDGVAKDADSYSFSVAKYGAQQAVDPYNPDRGNGVRPDGTPIVADPADAYRPWTVDDNAAWLGDMTDPPEIIAIDNELEITSDTHRDLHPDPLGYDELVDRFLSNARMVHQILPGTEVAGPSTCCWWFYWNAVDPNEKAAHGEDLLPYFLDTVSAADAEAGERSLDVFDVHYYPDGVFNDASDADTRAHRLRSTRSLWDPTYTDESWIGTDRYATDQADRNQVQLIPRFQTLLSDRYPGTKLGVTEWNFGAERDISGGLAIADVLGIFGREGLDVATYWTAPPAGSPAAAAFALYDGFGAASLPVDGFDPDQLGAYAARDGARTTLVLVNKDPNHDVLLALGGLSGTATIRHFSAVHPSVSDDGADTIDGAVVVPAYGAVSLVLNEADTDTDSDTDADTDTDADSDIDLDTSSGTPGCGCQAANAPAWWGLVLLPMLGLRRRAPVGHGKTNVRLHTAEMSRLPVVAIHGGDQGAG